MTKTSFALIAFLFALSPFTVMAQDKMEKMDHMQHMTHEASAPVAKDAGQVIHVGVEGMVCDFCAQSLKKVFLKDAAVQAIDISLEKKLVTLTLKKGKTLDDAAIKKHIDYAGYKVSGIHRMPITKK